MPKKKNIIKEIEEEIQEVEQWVIERKKFFIKLVWISGLIAVLLIASHLYLRIKGVGV